MNTDQDLDGQITALNSFGNEVHSRYPNLNTFIDGAAWVSDAKALIKLLEQARESFLTYKKEHEDSISRAKAERDKKSFFSRLVSPVENEKLHKNCIQEADEAFVAIENVIAITQEHIANVPTSKPMQTEVLRNLQVARGQLSLELRSINELIRQVNVEARQKKASLTGIRGGGMVGNYAKLARADITHEKEDKLSSLEYQKSNVTGKLLDLDKQIAWISHFHGDNPEGEIKVLRCSYCGRRVEGAGIPCESCGSVLSEYL